MWKQLCHFNRFNETLFSSPDTDDEENEEEIEVNNNNTSTNNNNNNNNNNILPSINKYTQAKKESLCMSVEWLKRLPLPSFSIHSIHTTNTAAAILTSVIYLYINIVIQSYLYEIYIYWYLDIHNY